MDIEHEVKCSDCGSRDLLLDITRGERVCEDCGLVVEEEMIDQAGRTARYSEDGETNLHTGMVMNSLIHDKGLSTGLHWQNKDYSGRGLPSQTRSQFYRMRKWQARSRASSSIERNLETAYRELARLCAALGLGREAQEEAGTIYKMSIDRDLVRGRSIDGMVAASVYLANQKLHLTRTLDSIVAESQCNRKEVSRAHKIIKSTLKVRTEIPAPSIYVGRLCVELGLPMNVQRKTLLILTEATERELTHGRSPMGVAAAAIYIAGRLENCVRTQREIADVSDVTEVTIRNRYKELAGELGYVLL